MTHRDPELPNMEDLERGMVYKIRCRNLQLGVWDGNTGFIGIRTKWGDRFLAKEYHWDTGEPYGTVRMAESLNVSITEDCDLEKFYTEFGNNEFLFDTLKEIEDGDS